jgi:hypothetical protein
MAIRASINFKSILVNQVYFNKLVGSVHWKNIVLADIHVNAYGSVFFYTDSFSFLESQQFSVNKGIADDLTLGSPDPIFSVSSVRSDNLNIIDYNIASFGKNLTNTVSFNEVQTFVTGKGITDPLAFSESVHTLLTYIRSFTDTSLITDSANFAVNQATLDSVAFADNSTKDTGKESVDSFGVSDQLLTETGKFLPDPVVMVDAFSITRQPYSFTFNDVSGVVTVTGAPHHNVTLADTVPAIQIEKPLQDYFTLDDFAQVDKDTTGVKVNVVGLTDAISYDHVVSSALLNKALLGNMVLNAR